MMFFSAPGCGAGFMLSSTTEPGVEDHGASCLVG
eukprot:CAMPEP_0180169122 /NCGR_PEP_ID=MMETSP0986-20121125/33081_1 /TAXON_ID=697907 /ORGANISM="non described non described, Strain CCMP2293" /LENGTH=33 /DNA_ID= /DNA_START= /DNA_END= /DNA_ORIENTATION=